ncbi:MAG: o-succinylbenzoate--CoA ligase [Deferribacteres bacterium]|nr:o-succinylbenzoate--CoA ligase [candidate division KSB1 bacterium]MCB9500908.1 o-succinylbenzoate--CoA ligase [Deferribacteres bacterium]
MQEAESLLARGNKLFPKNSAILSPEKSISFAEFSVLYNQLSQAFSGIGIQPGQRVAFLCRNSWQTVVLQHALIEYGAVCVALNTRNPAKELQQAIKTVSPIFLFYDATLANSSLTTTPAAEICDFFLSLQNFAEKNIPEQVKNFHRLATIIFTSGSSAQPKLAIHSFANHFYSAEGSNTNIALSPGDRWLLSLPLYHVGGQAILWRTMLAGACIVIADEKRSLLQNIADYSITHLSLVATQLHRLLQEKGAIAALRKCKALLLGGSAIPASLLETAIQSGLPIHTSYGSTEMSSQITTTSPGAGWDELRSSGHVLPGRDVKIDKNGEVLVRGKTRFMGYWAEGNIVDTFDKEGYFQTGDLGYFDEHTRLVVLGRKDNMFISGGENIQPEEIENALMEIDGVDAAIVVPVADRQFGQRPIAFVRWKFDAKPDEQIVKHLRQIIAAYKIPDRFFAWPQDVNDEQLKLNRLFFEGKAEEMLRS